MERQNGAERRAKNGEVAIPPSLAKLVEYLDSLDGRADLGTLERLLREARFERADLEPWCVFGEKGYKRNTVRSTEWYELVCNCWRSSHCSPIHDHRGVSCSFKVVEGTGTEVAFELTDCGMARPVSSRELTEGQVAAADETGIHLVANMKAEGEDLVTLHIYSPPIESMSTYRFADAVLEQTDVYTPASSERA